MTTRPTHEEALDTLWAGLGSDLADAIRDGRLDPAKYPQLTAALQAEGQLTAASTGEPQASRCVA